MKITRIETIPILAPLEEVFRGSNYSMTSRATIITRVHTDDGLVGESYNGDEEDTQTKIAGVIETDIGELLAGKDPMLVEAAWEAMLPVTYDILGNRKIAVMAMSAVDSALWDIVGKVAGLPLARLWGGYRYTVPAIAIGGYYGRSHVELAEEMHEYLELGFCGCKAKVGGASPEEDARRIRIMRDAAGPDFALMADANQGYTVNEALRFLNLVEDVGLRWFEEPVRWFNDRLAMRDVRLKANVSVAAGQSEGSRSGVRDLIRDGAIDVCNFDSSWSGGPSEWRRVAGLAAAFGVEMAHHEEPQVAVHLIASVMHGTYVEAFGPKRDPVFWNMVNGRKLKDGYMAVPKTPGLGLDLNWEWIDRHRLDKQS